MVHVRGHDVAQVDFATAHLLTHWDECVSNSSSSSNNTNSSSGMTISSAAGDGEPEKVCYGSITSTSTNSSSSGGVRVGVWCNLSLKVGVLMSYRKAAIKKPIPMNKVGEIIPYY